VCFEEDLGAPKASSRSWKEKLSPDSSSSSSSSSIVDKKGIQVLSLLEEHCLFVWFWCSGYRHCDAPRNEQAQKFGIPTCVLGSCGESTKETFSASLLKDPIGLHHANHHVFPIYWISVLPGRDIVMHPEKGRKLGIPIV
jgi:hypothetical protein